MQRGISRAGALGQSGNRIGVFRAVPDVLACGFSAGGLVAEASGSPHGNLHVRSHLEEVSPAKT
jgi:hypothetical protein